MEIDDSSPGIGRRKFLQVGLGLAAAAVCTPVAAQAAEAGRVIDLTGDATAELRAKRRSLASASPIFVGDRIATGEDARARLLLGRATEVLLGAEARLSVDRFLMEAGGTVTLGIGAVLVDRPPSAGSFRVRSPYGMIAVRGTRFFIGPTNDVFSVFVVRGSVSVAGAGRRILLGEGEGTDFPRRGAPPTLAQRWGEARIRAALAQVE